MKYLYAKLLFFVFLVCIFLSGCLSPQNQNKYLQTKENFIETASDKRHGIFPVNYQELIKCFYTERRSVEKLEIYSELGMAEYRIKVFGDYLLLVEFKKLSENETEVFVYGNSGFWGLDSIYKKGSYVNKVWAEINHCGQK